MTCKQVRVLASAHPFVQYAPRELRAADEHAVGCADCRAFWDEVRALDAELAGLPEIALPDEDAMTADIMARIAEVDEAQAVAKEAPEAATAGDWLPWGSAAGGVAVAGAAYSFGWLDEVPQLLPGAVSEQVQFLLDLIGQGPVAGMLLFGAMLYVAGLVALFGGMDSALREKGLDG